METLEYQEETAYVRVILLVLAVMTFSYVWENDHPPEQRDQTVVSHQIHSANEAVPSSGWSSPPGLKASSDISESFEGTLPFTPLGNWDEDGKVMEAVFFRETTKEIPLEFEAIPADRPTQLEVAELAFPLPLEIAIGEYRIVDGAGRVTKLTIDEKSVAVWGLMTASASSESYVTRRDTERWHFIRVESEGGVLDVLEHEDTTVDQQLVQQQVKETWRSLLRTLDQTLEPTVRDVSRPLQSWLRIGANRVADAF